MAAQKSGSGGSGGGTSASASTNRNGKRSAESAGMVSTGPGPSSARTAPASAAPGTSAQHRKGTEQTPRQDYTPRRRLAENYIEYDFAKMKDSKGGFLSEEKPLDDAKKLDQWKKEDRLHQPPTLLVGTDAPRCFECSSVDLDFKLYNVFKCRVCKHDRDTHPDKYSLLTKTECREDYLLTDPELRDADLLPHLERPNPHKTTFNNMMLYLRYQVEEFAFKKWGGPDALDAEYERRVVAKKGRKDKKFLNKLKEMRRTTRANTLSRAGDGSGGGGQQQHVHEWSAGIKEPSGMVKRRCALCGMTTEEFVMG